jgi:hypothetical protein
VRNLVFKNISSKDHSKRILFAKESFKENGISTTIQKHLIYFVREAKEDDQSPKSTPELFVLKEKNSKLKTETFFVKMKAGMLTHRKGKLYTINFLHSLRIILAPASETTK